MNCTNENCKSTLSLISINAKCSDTVYASYDVTDGNTLSNDGYAPYLGIGGGDYMKFKFCPSCGTIANFKPLDESDIIEAIEGM